MANITDIERLNYYEGEFLGALDFQAEQEYHRDMRRRHNLGPHTWGIISGLDLVQIPNGVTAPDGKTPEVDIYIQPGMAIDGFGREIVVLNKTQLTQDLFASFGNLTGPQIMSIWISYGQVMLQPPTDTCTRINQPNAFGRVQEAFALTVTQDGSPPPANSPIVVDGKTLPAPPPPQAGDIVVPDDGSIPYQEFSTDDSAVNWYVPLGRVFWDASNNGIFLQQTSKTLDDTWLAVGRQYAGIVSSKVYAPAASTVYAPGPGLTLKDRFTVSPLPTASNGVSVEVEGSLTVDRLLNAEQNVLAGSVFVFDPKSNLTISPVTINASQTDQSFIQFRDSSSGSPLFSIWETLAQPTTTPPIPAGLNFGEADNKTGKPKTSDLLIQGGNVLIDPGNLNKGSSLAPGLSFGTKNWPTTEGLASNQSGGGSNAFGLDFYTNSKAQLSIANNGNVGIGIQAPLAILDVRGQASFQGALSINNSAFKVTNNVLGSPNDQRAAITFGATDTTSAFYFGTYDGTTSRLTTILGLYSYQLGKWIQYWTPSGNVGIGTVSPLHQLEVVDTTNTGLRVQTNIAGGTVASFGGFGDFQIDAPGVVGGRLIVKENGSVGIGTQTPTATLDVNGNLRASGSIGGRETSSPTGWVLGKGAWGPDNWLRLTTTEAGNTYHDLAVNQFWAAGSQRFDLAEVTPANETDELEQGDVVVIDRRCGMQVTRSTKPFDTSVYGVVSSYDQASMVIGGFGGPEAVKGDNGKLPIALVGRAKAKVTAENGPIEVGDLLTTSSTPGHLMRCGSSRCIGSIVGKALESLSEAVGMITIRVSLS